MLVVNTRNDKLAAARVDFASRGMLRGTCLGEALRLWHQGLDAGDSSDDDNEDKTSGPDGNGEDGRDLDLDNDGNNDDLDLDDDGIRDLDLNEDGNGNDGDDIPPGPVDGPSIFSEVNLALRRGFVYLSSRIRSVY